jgi:hypothetical protein
MATVLSGSRDGIYLLQDTKGRTYIKGLNETRNKMIELGMNRNEFEKYIKDAAKIVAIRATQSAPRITGNLAISIRGLASKKYTKTVSAGGLAGLLGGTTQIGVQTFGGVVTAGSPSRVQYARRVSYGAYMVAGQTAKSNNSRRGYATRVWRNTVRTPGNAYLGRAREEMKPTMVELLNRRMRYWIQKKGFGI